MLVLGLLSYAWVELRAEVSGLQDAAAEHPVGATEEASAPIVVKKELSNPFGELLTRTLWDRTAGDEIRIWVPYRESDEAEGVAIEVFQCCELALVDFRLPACISDYPSHW